ncbi:acyl-CoA dehydrogenase [Dictyobacter alpinus]|uniref:Acyl-CoA dehydrogenase n=1 Tax=Dictyobacter alpinus TaxID=2014873 RepID=A0A402BHI3_9CHLR|nr:acyl-CoA dehydrogenase family protein [Dictyobacter alpinus]GCE30825.1 acyl-CoA dehydrogenase [Dictyobacter alpinus]
MFDFSLSPALMDLKKRTAAFVREHVIPEERYLDEHTGFPQEKLKELRRKARAAGLFAPHVEEEWGGMGLSMREMSVVFEEAGHSLLGPLALNCSAPDEGNMHLLEMVATPEQKERYLRPLVNGEIRSCFAMTEPPPGAGTDPSLLHTTAVRRGSEWVINGDKWYITGAEGAAFAICMARTEDGQGQDSRQPRASMFLIDMDNPGFQIIREIPSLDANFVGGHCEIALRDCVVPEEAVLGAVGEGFKYAQVRLAPARLTHCMRWLGVAQRSLDIAAQYANTRESFGQQLGKHQMVAEMIADSATEIHASRLMIWHAAWVLDTGGNGKYETSMTKTYVAEVVNRVVDRSLQICGSHGVSMDLPLALFYRSARPFRIYDGPSEIHRTVIARQVLKAAAQAAQVEGFIPEGAAVSPKTSEPEHHGEGQ